MMLRMAWQGALTGLLMTLMLAGWDRLSAAQWRYGLRSGIIGVSAGGAALLLAWAMAISAYLLATRNRQPVGRKRLLQAAIFTGCAGLTCGTTSAVLWLAAGHPWFR